MMNILDLKERLNSAVSLLRSSLAELNYIHGSEFCINGTTMIYAVIREVKEVQNGAIIFTDGIAGGSENFPGAESSQNWFIIEGRTRNGLGVVISAWKIE